MTADVCLLLVQSLSGNCDTANAKLPVSPPPIERSAETDMATVTTPTTIMPTEQIAIPRFGAQNPCPGVATKSASTCVEAAAQGENQRPAFSSSWHRSTGATDIRPAAAAVSPASARDAHKIPSPSEPLFSPSARVLPNNVELPPRQSRLNGPTNRSVRERPTSGPQLYRQRQVSLRAGQLYTRLSPGQFAHEWRHATTQPTYQDWLALLAQEARAVAAGQGRNRLEIVLGDSIGLWLPPETLPRDRLWLNQGISGDTTRGIMGRLSAFANTRPTTIHILAGANDLKTGVPEATIVNNLRLIVQSLKQQHPDARIVVYSVFPTRTAAITNDRVRSLNARIEQVVQQSNIEYRDMYGQLQDQWGHLRFDVTTDGLHLNRRGYALWQQAILASNR